MSCPFIRWGEGKGEAVRTLLAGTFSLLLFLGSREPPRLLSPTFTLSLRSVDVQQGSCPESSCLTLGLEVNSLSDSSGDLAGTKRSLVGNNCGLPDGPGTPKESGKTWGLQGGIRLLGDNQIVSCGAVIDELSGAQQQ